MANLDTRSKRASSVQIGLAFLLAPVLPDGVIAQADRQHTAHSYSGIAAAAPSGPGAAEDADATVTSRLDTNGDSVLCPEIRFRHAGDGLRAAELSNETIARADRHLVPFAARRASDDEARAQVHWVEMTVLRAGATFGIAEEIADLSEPDNPLHDARESTARLDVNGDSVLPAETFLRHARDSHRAFDITQADDYRQDRHRHAFPVGRTALRHWVEIEWLRAGGTGGIRDEEIDFAHETDGVKRVSGESS